MSVCQWRPINPFAVGCVALAVNGTDYCAAHQSLFRDGPAATSRIRKENPDADLLPLTQEEFTNLAELRERSRTR